MSSDLSFFWEAAGGNTPSHWNFQTIEELLEGPKSIAVGVMYPGKDTSEGVPLVKVSNVKSGEIPHTPDFRISAEVDEEYKRTRLEGNELLITLVGNPGDCVIVTPDMKGWNVARALAVMKLADPNLRPWLRYVLLSKPAKCLIEARLNTTVQKTLNLKDIRQLAIPIPPINERNSIVPILAALESKIKTNQRMNKTLEEMAQAIFKCWFVDFEPTRAKMAGESDESICKRLKITPDILALFPDNLVDSELGPIPEGWRAGELRDIARYSDNRVKSTEISNGNYISTENMLAGRMGVISASKIPDTKTMPSYETGNILISNIRPYFKKIWFAFGKGGRSNDVLGFAPVIQGNEEFLYNFLYRDEFFDFMMLTSKGAKMPRGDKTAIIRQPVILPHKDLMLTFSETVRPFYSANRQRFQNNKSLAQTRDALLPKLLSGEISVENIEVTP